MIALVFLLTIISSLLYWHYKKTYSYWDKLGIPNIKPYTFAGSFSSNVILQKAVPAILQEHFNYFKHARYFGMYQFTLPTLVIKDLDLVKKITIKDFDHFIDHANFANESLDPLWSKNIIALVGEKWRNMRATLSPAFTGSKMRLMFGLINDESNQFVDYFKEQQQEIIECDMKNVFSRVTNDVLASCAFGIKVNSMKDPNNDFFINGRKAFDFSGFAQLIFFMYSSTPRLMKLFGIKLFADHTSAYLRNIILEAIKVRERGGLVRPDMIHLMLEARRGNLVDESNDTNGNMNGNTPSTKGGKKFVNLTDEDIVAQAMIFHFGGFDTTSSSMVCLAYELAINPDIQKRLRDEIDATWEDCDGGKVTYEIVMKMKYLDACVSEGLRLWPPLILSDRVAAKDYVIEPELGHEKRIVVKKGSVIWIPIFALQRDPELFPDALRYDPERFSDENKHLQPTFAYMPFSIGPRNCIASRFALMTIKTIMFHLLRDFEIVPVEKSNIPFELSTRHVNVAPDGGLILGFKRRHH